MKIIRKSNFDHDDHLGDQYFVAQRLSKQQADLVVETLNNLEYQNSDDYYKAVGDDYVLPPEWQP
jgi:hypothetical protein